MFGKIIHELKIHSPFTLFGALTGVALAIVFKKMPYAISYNLFYVFHPLHIFLSAFVTAAIYRRHLSNGPLDTRMFLKILAVGFVISISMGTLSDSLIPFWGETLLGMPYRELHIGFVEKWWLINPLAVIAIIIACYKPVSKCPHAGHVLISTWASLLHMLMAMDPGRGISYLGIFVFLFLAVWIPCCFSDIVFPLLLVKNKDAAGQCGHCGH